MLLGGSLTTEGSPTNNPESERADHVRLAAFPPGSLEVGQRHRDHPFGGAHGRLVAVSGRSYAIFVGGGEVMALGLARTYLAGADNTGLVSEDRHATMVPIAIVDDDETEALVAPGRGGRRGLPSTSPYRRRDARP